MTKHKGIKLRHKLGCAKSPCTCEPSFRPSVYDRHAGRKLDGPTFRSLAEAKQWRTLKAADVERGKVVMVSARTLRSVAEEFLVGAERGAIRNVHGLTFKPSVLRDYRADLERRILPELGVRKIGTIEHRDIQRLIDSLVGERRLSGSRIRNILNALRGVFRYAISVGEIPSTPINTRYLRLPANDEKRRERIAEPGEGLALLVALPEADRAIWATAMFTGLRAGELRALRWDDVDLTAGRLRVERGWDDREGAIEPKSKKARRTVPLCAEARRYLVEQRLRCEWPDGLVFGQRAGVPFNDRTVTNRARRAWSEAGLQHLGLHEARHTYASLMFAAGVNVKAVSTYMGHSSVGITMDRYTHLLKDAEVEAAAKMDDLFARMTG